MKKYYRQSELDENQPNHYKWGAIYYDRADYRIIIPKKDAWMGWTFNFASPFTYAILTGMIALVWWLNQLL